MATSDSSFVEFFDTCRSSFCFTGADINTDAVDGDTYRNSYRSLTYQLQCKDSKFLLLNEEGHFRLQNLNTKEQCQPGSKFIIHIFHDISLETRQGVPVMLYAKKDDTKLMVCCKENNEVYPEAMDLPDKIEDRHKALFLLKKLTPNKYEFESSLFQSRFLGFMPIEDSPTLKKLVLRRKGLDGVDDRSEFRILNARE